MVCEETGVLFPLAPPTRAMAVVAVIVLSACSGATIGPPQTSPEAGLERPPWDGGQDDASSPADGPRANCYAAEGEAGGAAIANENRGSVIVSELQGECMLQAFFYRAGQRAYPFQPDFLSRIALVSYPGCAAITVGACVVVSANSDYGCDPPAPSCGDPIPSAGAITLSSPLFFGGPAITPNPDGTYPSAIPMTFAGASVFSDGDMLTFVAPGADVPPFQLSVVAPGCVAMTAPESADGGTPSGSYVISTAADLQVSWTGGEPDAFVGVTLIGWQANSTAYVSVSCSFDATLGQGTISQQALASLTGDVGSFSMYQERRNSLQAGSYHVQAIARNFGNFGSASADAGVCPPNSGAVAYQ